ncbi:ATP-grasp domain-containing protein [Paucilactobacillus suebicus]|uniref:Phosphoribosylaminoimidazole carboxylase ATPase subunit PurK n=1 Tax=Paucilactobacillus suebicus DSM 5007 = KCTC 3549 TaxID=1423807 RepID=A0A0R1W6M3_9LACO|nr:ATP-grasp domain-containing protein [Paucilactobacillus suebicus]KRM13319.1 phosphoribosylaminoimidazole carboxylase ATPase subunit PurK [Paucilactobacillus suebicus DSM 5007 = KCTC 3549]
MENKKILYPGNTIGIIGLGSGTKKLTEAAQNAGFKVCVYINSEAERDLSKIADYTVIGAWNDKDKLQEFGQSCDAVIYESASVHENVIEYLSQFTAIPQGKNILEVTQDRLLERAFLDQINVNIPPYVTVIQLDDVYQSIDSIGYPAMLNPIQRGLGEDSLIIERQSDIVKAADYLSAGTYVLESWIPRAREFSLIIAKNADKVEMFPLVETYYENEKLVEAKAPADLNTDVETEIQRIGQEVAGNVDYTGVFEISFYTTDTHTLYVKAITPALTRQGDVLGSVSNIDQYSMLLRTVAGLPIPTVNVLQNAILMDIKKEQLNEIKTQWLLKDNWQFNFYSETLRKKTDSFGYVLATGDTIEKLQMQIDNTDVWTNKKPEPNEDDQA